jgi:hypothetical protein
VAPRVRHKVVLWLVALVCVGPFAFATLLYYGPWGVDWLPKLPGNRVMLSTPVPLPPQWLGEADPPYRWSLIYARMTACEQQCAHHVERLLQVQLALNRDRDRLQRILLYVGAPPTLADRELITRPLDDALGASVAATLGAEPMSAGRIYVADPQGSVILSYPADIEQKELLRDLKRLLVASGKGS